MSQERQYRHVIDEKNKGDLKDLVEQAIVSGKLDISNFKINVDFNLAELLLACRQEKVPLENEYIYDWFTVECPFSIDANGTNFGFRFSSSTNDTFTIFLKEVSFGAYFATANFTRATFLQSVNFVASNFQHASFHGIQCKKDTHFMSCHFHTNLADFTKILFEGFTWFANCIFDKGANFSNTIFEDGINFHGTHFVSEDDFCARFTSSKFKSAVFAEVTFLGMVDLSFCTFSESPQFWKNIFTKKVILYGSTFEKESLFQEVVILQEASLNFDRITTHDSLGIIPTVLNGTISIEKPILKSDKSLFFVDLNSLLDPLHLFTLLRTHYQFFTYPNFYVYFFILVHYVYVNTGSVMFKGLEIDHDRMCLKIRNLKEESNIKVLFQDCGFYGKNVAFTNVYMQQVRITGGNYVSGMAFYHCKWDSKKALGFFQLIPLWLKFRAFDGLKTEDIPKKAESYGNLKVSALDAGDAQLSNDFHFWHQWHQRKGTFWNRFYAVTSAYGLSAMLPLLWFIVIALLFTYMYGASFQQSLENGFLTSLSASIPFVFNDVETIKHAIDAMTKANPAWLFYPLYILQHLIQGYLLFQIGAAIRNKVKR